MIRDLESHLAVPCRTVTQEEYGFSSFVLAPVAFPTSYFERRLASDFFLFVISGK